MPSSTSIFYGVSLMLLLLVTIVSASASTVTVYAWPLDAPSPEPLATVLVSQSSYSDFTASLHTFTPPSTPKDDLLRIGLYEPSTKSWTGVATSSKSLAEEYKKKISLHTDKDGVVHHVGFGASARVLGDKDEVVVEVVPIIEGPEPVLNKPVVLNAEGKIGKENPEEQKSFLQKYWWAIALFLVLQLVVGGGKE